MFTGHGDDLYHYKGKIKVNFSSNIYQRADLSALKERLAERLSLISNYPEPRPLTLESAIAAQSGIRHSEVIAANGATEAIYLAARALAFDDAGHPFRHVIKQPTFSEYADACRSCGIVPHSTAGTAGERNALWLCNPNNPTGSVLPASELLKRADRNPKDIFIIDQSYEDYTQESLISDREAAFRPNVLLLHSMTKRFCVPGLRLGYAVGNVRLTERLRRLQYPWSVNALAADAALWLIDNDYRPVKDLGQYLKEAQRLRKKLNSIDGITALDTATNFMLCRVEDTYAARLKAFLIDNYGFLIRDASNFEGLNSAGYFRVAAQLPTENDQLADAIKAFQEHNATHPARQD